MNMEWIKPCFQTRPYKVKDSIFVKDRYQSFLYVKHGAKPLDLFVDTAENLVMVFDKKETRELYEKYRKYELK